jgi:hypothetical protein
MGYWIGHRLKAGAGTLSLLALAGSSFDCMNKPLAPVAPTWETQMTAPVSAKSYTLADLIGRDSSLIGIAPGGTQLFYATTFQADPTYVGNLLSLSPVSCSSQIALGAFAVPGTSSTLPITLPGTIPVGVTAPITPMTLALPPMAGSLTGLDSVTFQSGTLELRLRNNLPVAVTVEGPVTLADASGRQCGTFDFSANGPIQPGTESVASFDLSGVFLTHTISITGVTLSEKGSATPLAIPADNLIVATFVANNPVVRSAVVTELPPDIAAKNVTASLAVTDSNLVKELTVKSGTMTLHIQNALPVNANFTYAIHQLQTPSGADFTDNVSLPAGGHIDRTVDLAGHRLHSLDGGFITAFDVAGSLSLAAGNAGRIRIQETDNIAFSLTTTPIVADSVVGVIKPTWVAVNAVLPIRLGDLSKKFKGHINIPAANLRLLPESTIRFPMQLDLRLEAESDRGQLLSEMDIPRTTTNATMQPIDFVPGEVGRFLSSISGQLPDSLRVRGTVLVNPAYDVSSPQSVGSRSWFGGQMQVSFPLTCSLTGGGFADTASIGDTSGTGQPHTIVDPRTAGDINSIKLHVVIDNGIPLQVAVKLQILDRAHRLLLSLPQSAGDSVTIPAPAVVGGTVQSPAHAERIIQLTGTEIGQFNGAYAIAYDLSVATPGTGAVRFESTQTFNIRVWAEFAYQVNK